MRIIDIETSKIEQSATYYFEGEMEQLLIKGIKLSLEKLIGSEPTAKKIEKSTPKANVKKTEQNIKPEPNFGYITFIIEPKNAKIVIDNKVVPKHQMDNYKIDPGTYGIEISAKGYKTYIDVVSVLEGQPIVITKSLAPEEKSQTADTLKTSSALSIYINAGPIEPWGDPGTGAIFNMGLRAQFGAQLNIGNWVKLPTVLQPLTAEVMVGCGMWNVEPDFSGVYTDGKTTVISVLALGRYDLTDLIMKAIGFENPALGIFGVAGLQYNMQSWDFPNWNREFDNVSAFGLNLGVGVKYNLQNLVGKPVEVDLRFTQGVFIMPDVKDQNGDPFYPNDKYQHTENGLLFGVKYPL
ncbi:MAG: PEGA domain-containing protein [Candidatus Omnitrophica bacterium]|nr:PEGA domain-containing protein [Candidatus Omnitrophota bacterium]